MKRTKLYDLAKKFGGKFVPFCGYEMPINFTTGIIDEHLTTRENCGLFDVSHMGQMKIFAKDSKTTYEDIIAKLSPHFPCDFSTLAPGQMKYNVLLNKNGGVIDDLIICRPHDDNQDKDNLLNIVVNASRKDVDLVAIKNILEDVATVILLDDHSLIAVQGPKARKLLADQLPDYAQEIKNIHFMNYTKAQYKDQSITIFCGGYTGEDGFEVSLPNDIAEEFTEKLLANEDCKFIGLGARDSLRLEAGLCLYGQDLEEDITPIEATIKFVIPKKRFEAGDFNGAEKMKEMFYNKTGKRRVGIKMNSRSIARPKYEIFKDDKNIGHICSGGFSPTLQQPIAFGYVDKEFSLKGTMIDINIRGKMHSAEIVAMPFVPTKYNTAKKTS